MKRVLGKCLDHLLLVFLEKQIHSLLQGASSANEEPAHVSTLHCDGEVLEFTQTGLLVFSHFPKSVGLQQEQSEFELDEGFVDADSHHVLHIGVCVQVEELIELIEEESLILAYIHIVFSLLFAYVLQDERFAHFPINQKSEVGVLESLLVAIKLIHDFHVPRNKQLFDVFHQALHGLDFVLIFVPKLLA